MEVVKNSKYKKRAEHFCFKYNMKNPKSDMKINSEKHIEKECLIPSDANQFAPKKAVINVVTGPQREKPRISEYQI